MKKLLGISSSILLIFYFTISSFSWQKDITLNEIKFKKARIIKDESRPYKPYIIGVLRNQSIVNGYHCAQDWIHLDKKGRVLLFKSASKKVINNIEIPQNTWVHFAKDRFICVFPFEKTIQGYKVMHGKGVKGTQTAFYNSGKLKYFFSKEDITIDGINCKGNPLLPINLIGLHENGKLMSCINSEEIKINGKIIKKGSELFFNDNGQYINM